MKMQTETLYEVSHDATGSILGIGTVEELTTLCDEGVLPPREEVTFTQVGTYPKA